MTLWFHRARMAATPLVLALSVLFAAPAVAQSAAPDGALTRKDVEAIVRDTLIRNPEILQEAMQELEKRITAEEDKRRREAVSANRARLFAPHDIVIGNPKGDVTLVEFFDYNCSYCKRALDDLIQLVKSDSKLKVVLKDFPVLRDSSVEAAKIAVAVRGQASPEVYFAFHQKLMGGRGEATRERALAVAKEVGLDVARLTRDADKPEVKAALNENLKLAQDLGLTGTPSYVIGEDVVVGAVGLSKLEAQIKAARAACSGQNC